MKTKAFLTLVAALLALAACDGSPTPAETSASTQPPSPSATTIPSETAPSSESTAPAEPTSPSASTPATTASTAAAPAAFEPFTVAVDERSADGATNIEVEMTQVEVRPDGLIVSLSSFNDSDKPAALAVDPGSMIVFDQDNNRYYTLRRPEGNPTLEFGPSEELDAQVAFPAAFDEPPSRLELYLNYTRDPFRAIDQDTVKGVQALKMFFQTSLEPPS